MPETSCRIADHAQPRAEEVREDQERLVAPGEHEEADESERTPSISSSHQICSSPSAASVAVPVVHHDRSAGHGAPFGRCQRYRRRAAGAGGPRRAGGVPSLLLPACIPHRPLSLDEIDLSAASSSGTCRLGGARGCVRAAARRAADRALRGPGDRGLARSSCRRATATTRSRRHRDVTTASRHPEIFRSGQGAVSLIDLPPEMVEYFSGMISTDNPRHTRLRRIVSNAFNPRRVQSIEDSIDRVAREVVDRVADEGRAATSRPRWPRRSRCGSSAR